MLTRRFADFVIDTQPGQMRPDLLGKGADAFMDTLGAGLAGSLEPLAGIVAEWAGEAAGRPVATLWGRDLATSPAEAAFANGMSAHALDFDDSLPSMRSHPSATMVPAALAVGDATGASGAAVAAAYVLGLEVAGKLGKAVSNAHFRRGWHTTATVGIFSSTAVAAKLWGLDAAKLSAAWGIAASQVGGLGRNFGTMTKPLHAGHAARCGVMSAWLAGRGFTADMDIFDGPGSLLATYGNEGGVPMADLLPQLGNPWEIEEPGIYVKRWACCYCNHRPIGGLLELIDKHGITPQEVRSIEVGFLPGSDVALLSQNPQTGLEGKFSIEYVAAATVLDRKLTLETFTDAMVQRPEVRRLMKMVHRHHIEDSGFYSGLTGYTDVSIETARGRFETRVERTPGSPAWPVSAEDQVEKFLDCSGRVLGEAQARRLLAVVRRFTDLPDIRELTALLRPAAGGKSGAA